LSKMDFKQCNNSVVVARREFYMVLQNSPSPQNL
jgi:hypothetical protein